MITLRRSLVGALLGGLALLIGTAHAQQANDDARKCAEIRNADQAIEVCTRAINSGSLDEKTAAVTHYNRGNAWFQKRDLDKAAADYDATIRALPDYAVAYNNRAAVAFEKGDFDKALADFNKAVSLNPRSAGPFNSRARVWLLKGEPNKALPDLDAAVRLSPDLDSAYGSRGRAKFYRGQFAEALPDLKMFWDRTKNPYALIWSYFAKSRIGQDGKPDLDLVLTVLKPNQWPAPLVQMLQGKMDAQALRGIVAKTDSSGRGDQSCEVEFYLGELAKDQNKPDEAERSFKRALEICPKTFFEYEGAVNELSLLKK